MSDDIGWIGVDFDGTLAYHDTGDLQLGRPIRPMVTKVKELLAQGKTVKIVTARVAPGPMTGTTFHIEEQRTLVGDWTELYLGQRLEVTCSKDFAMLELWDDRCRQVIRDRGMFITEAIISVVKKL